MRDTNITVIVGNLLPEKGVFVFKHLLLLASPSLFFPQNLPRIPPSGATIILSSMESAGCQYYNFSLHNVLVLHFPIYGSRLFCLFPYIKKLKNNLFAIIFFFSHACVFLEKIIYLKESQ